MTGIEEIDHIARDAALSAKSAHRRIDTLEQEVGDLHRLTEAVAVTANNVERLQDDVTEIKDDVKSLSAVPAKRWDAVIGYVLAALASGLTGAVIGIVLK
ncbi:MAG: hypothetical protein ACI39E_02010 [Acutalibacteraceae bacterium]